MIDLFDKVVYHALDLHISKYQAAATQSERDKIDKDMQNVIRLIAPIDYIKFYRYYLTNRKEIMVR